MENPSYYWDEKFYKMYSETSHVVDSTTNWDEDNFIDEKWFKGAHVLNLVKIRQHGENGGGPTIRPSAGQRPHS